MTTINFAEEQVKDKYCKTARDKFEKACKKQEALQDSLEIMRQSSVDENTHDDSPRDGDQGYQTDEENVYNDEEEIVELDNGLIRTPARKTLVPESLKEKILKRFHDSPYAGHLGVKKTTARIQRRFKWLKMAKEIKEYVRRCEVYAKRKAVGANKAPLNPIPPPDDVWQTMAMDIMGR